MALKDGDVVRFDYTLWVDGKPVETSEESIAKKEGIFREGRHYRPLTLALGNGQIIPGLESHLRSHGQVGKTVKVELAPAEAYGERTADKVRDVPMAQFRKQKVEPKVGMTLNLEGQQGVVTRVAGGRVRVDLNHDLAGKPLTYEYTLREVVQDDDAKVKAVLDNLFRPGTYKVTVEPDAVTLEVPEGAKFDQNWMMAKFRIVAELRAATQKKRAIRLLEVFPVSEDEPGHEGHNHGPGEGH